MVEYTRREYLALGGAGAIIAGTGYYVTQKPGGGGRELPECGTEPPANLDPPVIGDPGASVTVTEFADFSCPHCREYVLDVFPQIQQRYIRTGKIRYEHRDFPIPVTIWSRPAANAARSVQHLGGDKAFFEYATTLYHHQGDYSYELFNKLADAVNVPGEKVEQAARDGAYCAVLNESIREGIEKGVDVTPTLIVNGKELRGPSVEELSSAIEEA